MKGSKLYIIVMGGSLGGLTAALALRDAGCGVDVYERSPSPLMGLGAGIVLNPATVRYFLEKAILDIGEISVAARWLRYMNRDGEIADEKPCTYRFSSYNALYWGLLNCFDADKYHLGEAIIGFGQDDEGVQVSLASGRNDSCDLLVCADGIRSTGRRLLLPDVALEYAGYIAWRGTVGEDDMNPQTFALLREAITYHIMPDGHLLVYPIPVVDRATGATRSFLNWLWYRNVPKGPQLDDLATDKEGVLREVSLNPGTVREQHIAKLRQDASSILPASLVEIIHSTAQPFIQIIFDCEVPQMVFGRVCLVGDAAFVARPHAAAGTARAAEDGWQLAQAIKVADDDLDTALRTWEANQLRLGRGVLARTREAGRKIQFEGTWQIGDPLPFGLYEIGDSSMPD
ncbi:MAG TPA: FAD binding domain-containing protein [Ktedonobacteraceae bacterium]